MCVMKLFVALLVRGDTTTAPGRTVPPALYYRFEDAARPGADTMGHHDLLPTAASTLPLPAPTPGGAVGAFAAFDGGNTSEALAAGAGAWNCSASSCDGVTVEFLLRAGPNFNKAGETPVLQSRGEGSAFAFEALLARHAYGLHAGGRAYGFPQQLYAGADVLAPLEGVGRAAHGWLLDGGWHHVAMRKRAHPANASECVADIWLDGQSPAGFSSTGPAVGAVCTFSTGEPLVLLPAAFGGDIDEVAVWTTALTDTHIAAHAAGALRTGGGVPYCYTDPGGALPPADPTGGPFDLREFAPGTQLPTPPDSPNGTRGVALTCLQQLQAFPPPRYAANNSGGRAAALPPLSNCMDPDYMAGENQPGCKKDAMINGSLAVQAELAAHWSYALFAGNVNKAAVVGALHPTYAEQAEGFIRLLQLANAHPEWPFEAEIIRANVINVTAPKGPHNKPAIVSQFLPAACYLQDASGTFIDYSGATVLPGKYGLHKYKRPFTEAGGAAHGCPDTLFDSDGENFRWTFASLVAHGNLTVPILRLWEDGEIMADVTQTGAYRGFEKDPVVLADYRATNLTNVTGGEGRPPSVRDWRSFASRWRTRLTARFRDAFMRDPSTDALLGGAAYGEFEVEGTTAYFGRWSIERGIMSDPHARPAGSAKPMNDYYVTHPREWDVGAGSWHGLDWANMVTPSQLAAGDAITAPFVSGGWAAQEEKNVRPAQYLGLLKCYAALGAEVFYAGFFQPSGDGKFAPSQNWAWVAAMPAYAQAVTSRWAELLYDGGGILAPGDMPVARLIYNIPPDITPPTNYRTWAGSQSVAVYVRRATDGSGTLLVVGTVQPQSSAVGNTPLALNATLRLPGAAAPYAPGGGQSVVLEFRRQGSTYLIQRDGIAGGVGSVTQLDAWHESSHPAYWSADIEVEAEVFDGRQVLLGGGGSDGGGPVVRTERPTGAADGDFSAFTTWVELSTQLLGSNGEGRGGGAAAAASSSSCAYTVRPRCAAGAGASCEYGVSVRLAQGSCVAVAVAIGGRPIAVGHGAATATTCSGDAGGGWVWVEVGAVTLEHDATVVLTIAAAGRAAARVDALRLVHR